MRICLQNKNIEQRKLFPFSMLALIFSIYIIFFKCVMFIQNIYCDFIIPKIALFSLKRVNLKCFIFGKCHSKEKQFDWINWNLTKLFLSHSTHSDNPLLSSCQNSLVYTIHEWTKSIKALFHLLNFVSFIFHYKLLNPVIGSRQPWRDDLTGTIGLRLIAERILQTVMLSSINISINDCKSYRFLRTRGFLGEL